MEEQMADTMESRVRCKELHSLFTTPENCVQYFKDGMNVGMSGFTPVGYPKVVPIALCDHVEKNNMQGQLKLNLFIGASVGAEVEDRMASLNMIDRRWPYQTGKELGKAINRGDIRMGDKHLSMFAQDLKYGFYTKDDGGGLDIAVIEASAITEDGNIILSGSIGASNDIIDIADKIIVEINTGLPSFEGMHDIFMTDLPPYRQIIPITDARQRIGTPWVPTDTSKIVPSLNQKCLIMAVLCAELILLLSQSLITLLTFSLMKLKQDAYPRTCFRSNLALAQLQMRLLVD